MDTSSEANATAGRITATTPLDLVGVNYPPGSIRRQEALAGHTPAFVVALMCDSLSLPASDLVAEAEDTPEGEIAKPGPRCWIKSRTRALDAAPVAHIQGLPVILINEVLSQMARCERPGATLQGKAA